MRTQNNGISDEGARKVARALLHNTSITSLDMTVSGGGGKLMHLTLKHAQVNQIEDAGAEALELALKSNATVITLDVSVRSTVGRGLPIADHRVLQANDGVGRERLQSIAELGSSNRILKVCDCYTVVVSSTCFARCERVGD